MRHGILSEDPRPTIRENESKLRCIAGVASGSVTGVLLAWCWTASGGGIEGVVTGTAGFVAGTTATLIVGWEGGIGRRHALLAGTVAFGLLTLCLLAVGMLTLSSTPLHLATVYPTTILGALTGAGLLHPIRRGRINTAEPSTGGCPFTPVQKERGGIEEMEGRSGMEGVVEIEELIGVQMGVSIHPKETAAPRVRRLGSATPIDRA